MRQSKRGDRLTKAFTYALLIAGSIGFLLPLFWAISSSLSSHFPLNSSGNWTPVVFVN